MKIKKIIGFFSFCVLLFCSCASTKTELNDGQNQAGPVVIRNNTNEDVVLFIGCLENNKIFGQVKACSENRFDPSKIEDMPEAGAFIARAVLRKTVEQKKVLGNNDVLYKMLITYNSLDEFYKSEVVIPEIIDTSMQYGLRASNDSDFILVLRENAPYGDVVATLSPYERNSIIYLKPESPFPITLFTEYHYVTNYLKTAILQPNKKDFTCCMPSLLQEAPVIRIPNLPAETKNKLIASVFDYCELQIRNETEYGLQLLANNSILSNTKGIKFSQPGSIDCYELVIEEKEQQLFIQLDNNKISLEPYKFKKNHEYEISIFSKDGKIDYSIREIGEKERRMNLLFE